MSDLLRVHIAIRTGYVSVCVCVEGWRESKRKQALNLMFSLGFYASNTHFPLWEIYKLKRSERLRWLPPFEMMKNSSSKNILKCPSKELSCQNPMFSQKQMKSAFLQPFSSKVSQIKNIWTQQISEVLKFFNTCIESIVDKIATKIVEPTFTSIHYFWDIRFLFTHFKCICTRSVQLKIRGKSFFFLQFYGARPRQGKQEWKYSTANVMCERILRFNKRKIIHDDSATVIWNSFAILLLFRRVLIYPLIFSLSPWNKVWIDVFTCTCKLCGNCFNRFKLR